jgi:putative acetyltransferase
VILDGSDEVGMGLAPMAVLPAHQGTGIGSALVRHGLDHLRRSGCPFVVVLGHPGYYPRFGFQRAAAFGVRCQWEGVPDDAFMLVVFRKEAIPGDGAVARYGAAFHGAT